MSLKKYPVMGTSPADRFYEHTICYPFYPSVISLLPPPSHPSHLLCLNSLLPPSPFSPTPFPSLSSSSFPLLLPLLHSHPPPECYALHRPLLLPHLPFPLTLPSVFFPVFSLYPSPFTFPFSLPLSPSPLSVPFSHSLHLLAL